MQSYNIIIAKRFTDELGEILGFIALSNPNQAVKFNNEIYAKIASLATNPYRCRANTIANDTNVRDMIFKGYVVVFAIDEFAKCVEILGIYKNNLWKP